MGRPETRLEDAHLGNGPPALATSHAPCSLLLDCCEGGLGLVAQEGVAVGDVTHALLLEPKGKLVVDLRAARVADDEWWLVCEGGFGPVLAAGLKRFRIRVKVDLDDRSDDLVGLALRDFEREEAVRLIEAG